APASRRRGFHSRLIQPTPETSDRPTGLDRQPLRREYPRQRRARRGPSAQKSVPTALSENKSCDRLENGRVKAHRNVAPRNGMSRRRNRCSPVQSVVPRASMATLSLLAETAQNILLLSKSGAR